MMRILIVENDNNIRRLYKKEFSELGYDVSLARTTSEALERVRSEHPALVVLDPGVSVLDELQSVSLMQSIDDRIQIILNSDSGSHPFAGMFDAYVRKTSDLSDLKKAIRNLLSSHHKEVHFATAT